MCIPEIRLIVRCLYFLEQSTEMGPIWDKNEVELEYEKQKGV